ncbi:hypothetical protein PCASD_01601 [Puccinia coronata f. sp. avenae]|uniref:Uncharacterized protein n=1 Tax=Puccinia coronata f. sp. avenae TaxID=200324 RepID=A0A2N5VIF9_9BASI|nr:hypothetical protein PCASD_01601 [Puccinia coronata f. sp. avenae]
MAIRKSAGLLEIEKKLLEVEARIAADRKRREIELKAAMDQAACDAEAIKQMKARQKSIQSSTPGTPNLAKPNATPPNPNPTVSAARGTKELPEPALFLLRDLWSHLGYTGESFVEMQMEISRELDRADFARFEREMICNEVIGARSEINMLREERTQLLKRLDLNRENINQLVETEERTYKTLMAERATSENVIRGLEAEIRDLKAERQGAQERIASLSNELERAEKARIAAVLYAKGAEDRASAANATALAAVEVANRQRETAPPPPPPPPVNPMVAFWPAADDEALKNKLKERILAVEEEKLASQLASVKDEREKLIGASPRANNSNSPPNNQKEASPNNTKGNQQNSENNRNNKDGDNNKNKNNNSNNNKNNKNTNNDNDTDKDSSKKNNKKQSGNNNTNNDNHRARISSIMDLF